MAHGTESLKKMDPCSSPGMELDLVPGFLLAHVVDARSVEAWSSEL